MKTSLTRYYDKADAIKLIAENLESAEKTLLVLEKAQPVITLYASKNKLMTKKCVTMLEAAGVYSYIGKESYQPALSITDAETRKNEVLYLDHKQREEHGNASFLYEIAINRRIEGAREYVAEQLENQKRINKVWQAVEKIRAIQDTLTDDQGNLSYILKEVLAKGSKI